MMKAYIQYSYRSIKCPLIYLFKARTLRNKKCSNFIIYMNFELIF